MTDGPIQAVAVRQSSSLQPSPTLVVAQRVSHSLTQATEEAADESPRSDADVDIGTLQMSTSHSNTKTTLSATNDKHTDDPLHQGVESLVDVDHVNPVDRAASVEVDMSIPLDCFDPGAAPAKSAASSNAVRRSRKKANSLPTLPSARSCKELERDGAKEDKDDKNDKAGLSTSTRATSAQMLLSQLVSLSKDANSSFAEQTLASSLIFQSQCIDLLRVQRQGHDARIQYLERTLSRMEQVLSGMTQQLTQIAFYNQALLERVFSGVVHSQMSPSEGATPQMMQQAATSPIGEPLQSTMRIETPSDASTQSHSQTTTRSESPSAPSLSPTASPEQMTRPHSAPCGLSLAATSAESVAMQQSVPQLVSLSNSTSGYKSMAILTPLSYTKSPVEQPTTAFPSHGSPPMNMCGTFSTVPPPPFSPIQLPPPSGPATTASIPLSIAGAGYPGASLSAQLPHPSNQYSTPFSSHFVRQTVPQMPQFATVVPNQLPNLSVMASPGSSYVNNATPHVAQAWSWNNSCHSGNTGHKSAPTSKHSHGRRK